MEEYALSLGPQRLDGARCVVENELEVGVGIVTVVDQPELDVIRGDLSCSHAAQADHGVVVSSGHRIDAPSMTPSSCGCVVRWWVPRNLE